MKRMIFLLWVSCVSVWAVSLGDTQQAVKNELGRPVSVRKEGALQVHRYADGVRVSFESGVVVAVVDAGGKVLAGGVEVERQPDMRVQSKPVQPKPEARVQKPVEQVPGNAPQVVREVPESVRVDVPARKASLGSDERVKGEAFPLLAVVGMGLLVIFHIWFIVEAFSESAMWGLGVMFVPFVSLIFTIVHWERAKKPFVLSLLVALPIIFFAGLKG